jgi:hypothetical protein
MMYRLQVTEGYSNFDATKKNLICQDGREQLNKKPALILRVFYSGAPGGTRTPDTRFRKPLLYPAELRAQNGGESGIRTHEAGFDPLNRLAGDRLQPTRPSLRNDLNTMVRPERFELPAYRSVVCRSIQLSYGRLFLRKPIIADRQTFVNKMAEGVGFEPTEPA